MKLSRPLLAAWFGAGCLVVAVVVYGVASARELAAESAEPTLDPSAELKAANLRFELPALPAEAEPVEYEDLKRGWVRLRWIDRSSPQKQ
jgi:hypothetical protein